MSMQCERVKNEEKVAVHARKKAKTSDTSKQKEGVLWWRQKAALEVKKYVVQCYE